MKKVFVLSLSMMLLAFTSIAQRYAIIDTKYILGKIPEYVDADKSYRL